MNHLVTSKDLSQKLKDAGVEQNSQFYWQQYYSEMKGTSNASGYKITQTKTESKKGWRCYSAFLSDELLEKLPPKAVMEDGRVGELTIWHPANDLWQVGYVKESVLVLHSYSENTLSESAGKLLLHLHSQGLIKN